MHFKKNGLKTIILAALLTIMAAPYADAKLPVGTEFAFSDYLAVNKVISSSGTPSATFTHILNDSDFDPALQGGENIDIRAGGQAVFEWMIKPTTPMTIKAYLDGILLGQQTFTSGNIFEIWTINLPAAAFNALEDRTGVCTIGIVDGTGSATISSSTIGGAGVVVPEPISLMLFTSGLVALGCSKTKKAIN